MIAMRFVPIVVLMCFSQKKDASVKNHLIRIASVTGNVSIVHLESACLDKVIYMR
jgi:hypothetical protein